MIRSHDDDRTARIEGRSRSSVTFGLNFLGIGVVAFWLIVNGVRAHYGPWVFVLGAIALGAWAFRELGRGVRARSLAGAVMVVVGSAGVIGSDSLLVVPVIVGVVLLQATTSLPVWTGTVAALVATVEIAAAATIAGSPTPILLGSLGGLALGVLIGFSRRQARVAEAQQRQAEDESRRAQLLADKSRAARDIHDVLAHSLGGLVLQLDAVEALLEAGRTDEATTRAGDARRLAADGLAEARRAVAALREESVEPDTGVAGAASDGAPEPATRASGASATGATTASRPPAEPGPDTDAEPTLADLVDAHRAFGGEIVVQGDTTLSDLDDRHAAAVVATCREALSNARRHAPGRPVSLSVIRDGDAVDVVVANPLRSGGHGLVGMRERFDELADASAFEAERSEDEFVVAMHLPAADARVPGADA